MELTLTQQVLLWSFGIAAVMGAVVNKTNFCTMGAVSDWVNMGDTGRFRAWLLAIAVAMVGVTALGALAQVDVDSTLPPYRTASFAWLRYLVGGLMFGIGMTLASGCGNKTLIRIGGGNLKSVVVLAVAGVMAYYMTNPLHADTDQTLYGLLFHGAVQATSIDLPSQQDLGAVLGALAGAENVATLRLVCAGLVALGLLAFVFKSAEFRGNVDNILGGTVVGLAVVAGWYVTGGPLGGAWVGEVEWLEQPPIDVAVQSYTFINPMGEAVAFLSGPQMRLVSFGLAGLAGVVVGSFVWSVASRGFRFEWFQSLRDVLTHLVGAVLMGVGGVLAMGCTVGQGITGFSTLALGSILAFAAIVLGSALTMKVSYYKLVYEDEASFLSALLSALADLRLLPAAMRKLDKV